MFGNKKIRGLVHEANTYRSQGLLVQSRNKYLEALTCVVRNPELKNRGQLLDAVRSRISEVEEEIQRVEGAEGVPELSDAMQNIIKKRFSFSEDREIAAYEGAVALARFGQYEQALEEFQRLQRQGVLPLVAAKNIITCHLTFASPEVAVAQFENWVCREAFTREELEEIRKYFKVMFKKNTIRKEVPELDEKIAPPLDSDEGWTGTLPIATVNVKDRNGQPEEFDVTYQTGNIISLVVPCDRMGLLNSLKPGNRVSGLQCYSEEALWRCDGLVFGKAKIESGPRQGDFLLEMTVNA
jgi:hypothetical protein